MALKNPQIKESAGLVFWRKGWDLNPRYGITVYRISSPAHSTTLPPFRVGRCHIVRGAS